jgi:hypothetical protein
MRRSFFAVLSLGVAIFCTSCGSGSSSGGGGGSTTFVPGKWTISLFSTTNTLGPIAELDLDLSQSGNTISSSDDVTLDDTSCNGNHDDSSTGSVSGDKFKLVFSIDENTITLNGTLDPGGKSISITNGKWTPNGGCLGDQHGSFTATFVPALSGLTDGTLQVDGIANPPTVTATLAEDEEFDVSGSMDVTGDPCFSSIAVAPGNLGISIGSLSSFEMTDGANVIDFIGQIVTGAGSPFFFNAQFNVVAGCTEQSGDLQLGLGGDALGATQDRSATAPRPSQSKLNPLLAARMKALVAARHARSN